MTTTRRPKMKETEQLALAREVIIANHEFKLNWRSEVLVTIPNIGQVPGDHIFTYSSDTEDCYAAVEAHALGEHLLSQVERWAGIVNEVWCCFGQPKNMRPKHHWLISELDRLGAGRIVFSHCVPTLVTRPVWYRVDTRIIEAAFAQGDSSLDPPAGSAGVKRQTEARGQWEPLRKLLNDWSPMPRSTYMTWKFVKRECPEMRKFTANQARKAIDAGECLGVGYRGYPESEFFAK